MTEQVTEQATDLAGFLLARIAEYEAAARAAARDGHPGWSAAYSYDDGGYVWAGDGIVVHDEGRPTAHEADHIARHDPARVMAECDAKRRIVEEHGTGADPCDHAYDTSLMGWTCTTLRLLALPYAGRPDFREEWRP